MQSLLRRSCVELRKAPVWVGFIVLFSSSCDDVPSARPVEPEWLTIPAGKVTLGFAKGTIRKDVPIPAYRISRYPVTRAEYAECAAAGICREDSCHEAAGLEESDADRAPVDCVSWQDAQRFCTWVSGRLPSLAEWMRAARGEQPSRFAWGDTAPACAQHPWAGTALSARSGASDARFGRGIGGCSVSAESFKVGSHPEGMAVSGMHDVLLTPAELLRGIDESPFGACRPGGDGACVVYGLHAGAIDGVSDVDATGQTTAGAGFRCAQEMDK